MSSLHSSEYKHAKCDKAFINGELDSACDDCLSHLGVSTETPTTIPDSQQIPVIQPKSNNPSPSKGLTKFVNSFDSSDQQVIAENELREQIRAILIDPKRLEFGETKVNLRVGGTVDRIMQLFAKAKQAWTVEARINEREGMIFIDEKTGEETQEPFSQYRFVGSGLKLTWSEREAELQTPTAESEVEG